MFKIQNKTNNIRPVKYKVELTAEEREELEGLVKKQSTAQNIAKRARIILMADESIKNNNEIAQVLGIVTQDITKWTKRWVQSDIEDVEECLKDRARSGRPSRITAEQWCNIMALACETPESHGVPITHWSHSTLTQEILKQGIVDKISMSHVGDFLKKQNYNHTEVSIG